MANATKPVEVAVEAIRDLMDLREALVEYFWETRMDEENMVQRVPWEVVKVQGL